MREAHAHIAAFGQSLAMPSLAACESVGQCLDVLRALASKPNPPFLRLHSARVQAWTDPRWPTLDELDRACTGPDGRPVPCVIMSFDHHAAAANTAALKLAGLTPGQIVPPNGRVDTDPATGRPSGLLVEQAAYRAWEAAPEPSPSERRGFVREALRALSAHGFTEVHDLFSQDWLGPELAELERSGELPVRHVRLYPAVEALPRVHAGRSAWESSRVQLAGGKLFADGTLNSRTALILDTYHEPLPDAPQGRWMLAQDELEAGIRLTESLGLHLAVHAIGDAAVRRVLDALQAVATRREPDNRHRIEHAEIVDEADVPRFASIAGGVVCSVQPCHLLTDIEVLRRQLPHRLHRVLPLRDLIQAGCAPTSPRGDLPLLWFGSDVPIVRPDPEDSLLASTQRRRSDQPPAAAIAWDQRLTRTEALAAFSAG